ncbi:SusC/RagA family TonB-linked outer membrane protein [Pedobacter frigiditerrae]|uniref:SusC/RagA family TonB-linked outer membrane protein n=1 Tax=Pedobacter frigiditerrae TaxID=2530452 RepID=A0A4V2MIF2_9SPHI|nr:SusC/RagA family TonB-linked outer membrane protein [Pedobacter frigiditerrae]TCC90086.1 SusC/RagA family TonB-linked outer membrane protein [Pedobacter frigiditerrae]
MKIKIPIIILFLIAGLALQSSAQERTVIGTVKASEDGLPIPGASIKVKDASSLGTTTGVNGEFTLKVPSNAKTLQISYLGYTTQEIAISGAALNISLVLDSKTLDQVVVTAGGVNIKRREQGNQSTTIKARELTQAKAFNVASALTGKVAGLQVNAVSSGVNPTIRLVLRGNRSLLGNNQALVVLDNVIVPNSVLGNLNPEDIEDIQVLNGAGAASLYGSDASNGALIITTKTGKRGVTAINLSNTTTLEQVSFLPILQEEFGSGTGPDDVPTYTEYENQQYGPRFDGSLRIIGKPLSDGSIQSVPYSWNESEGKQNFWETGIANQTDFSLSSGDDKGSYYVSSQYFNQESTVPGDKYNRFTIRVNGKRDLGNNVVFQFNTNYVQNRFDTSTASGAAFTNVLMSPGQIPLTRYSDWKNDRFANPNGYYNEYFANPYFSLANNRGLTRNDYLTGLASIKWNPIKSLSLLFRTSINTRNFSSKSYTNKFTYSAYRKGISGANVADVLGAVNDGAGYTTQISPEFQAQYIGRLSNDFSLNAILGASSRSNTAKTVNVSATNLIQGGLFNIGNSLLNPGAGENNSTERQQGVYGDLRLGFKNYLYLHASGRNDWRSVLAKENRSFFYPAADISFIASDAIPFIKKIKSINSLKLRGGISRVGNVNIGAYSLVPTFGQQFGFPFAGAPGFGLGNRIIAASLEPELTDQIEGGIDFELFNSRLTGAVTYYSSKTTNQTVPVGVPSATGFTSFLTNTGEVTGKGWETSLRLVAVQNKSTGLEVTVGGNYTFNDNKVVSISDDLPQLNIVTSGNAIISAVPGKNFPFIKGTTYQKDDKGRIIVDRITGFPSVTTTNSDLGNTDAKHRLGLDATVAYKGFRLAGLFEYRGSFVMYNAGSVAFDFSGAGIRNTYFNRERFVVPNSSYLDPVTNTYVVNTNITTRTGGVDFWTNGPSQTAVVSNYLHSAAFWKLRELSLSYELPKSVLGNIKYIKGAVISVQGRNLFIWTPKTNIYTDPEYSAAGADSNGLGITNINQTPPARFYGATLTLTL